MFRRRLRHAMRGAVRLRAGSLLGHHRPKGEEGASSCSNPSMSRAAKGTAASTSSQPQAVIDSSADTSAPLASRLAGGRRLLPWDAGFSIGRPASKSSSVRGMPSAKLSSKRSCSSNEVTLIRETDDTQRSAPGAGTPTGDFWKRSGQHEPRRVPGRGAPPPSKSSSIGHTSSNEAALTREATDTNRSAPGAGTPTGDFWKRSGQHEPRRVPGRGAPLIEVVFHRAQPSNEAVPTRITPDTNRSAPGAGAPTGALEAKRTA